MACIPFIPRTIAIGGQVVAIGTSHMGMGRDWPKTALRPDGPGNKMDVAQDLIALYLCRYQNSFVFAINIE